MALTIPNTFNDGELIIASKFNENFTAIKAGVDANTVDIATLQKQVAWVTPEMFGAVGDGITDDGPAWNSAIASLSAGSVIAGGNYAIKTPVTLKSGVNISGNGARITKWDNVIFSSNPTATATNVTSITTTVSSGSTSGTTAVVLAMSSVTGFAVGDTVRLYGDAGQSFFSLITDITGSNITLSGRLTFTIGTNPKLELLSLVDCSITGITFYQSGSSSNYCVNLGRVRGVKVSDCLFAGTSSTNISGISSNGAFNKFTNNVFRYNASAITVYEAGPETISGNRITDSVHALRAAGCHGLVVTGNWIENGFNQSYGYGLDFNALDASKDKNCFHTIDSNTIINQNHGVPGSGLGGIHLNFQGNYCVISNNKVQRNGIGIYLENANSYNTIVGNNASYNDGYYGCGIQLDWDNCYNVITGNDCSFNTGSTNGAEGIGIELRGSRASHSNTGNTISGNVCTNNSNYGIVATSIGTSVTGNTVALNGTNISAGDSRAGIRIDSADKCVVSGNAITFGDVYDGGSTSAFTGHALTIANTVNSLVSGNTITQGYYSSGAVEVITNSAKLKISENLITHDGAIGNAVYLHGVSGYPLTNIQVTNNLISMGSNGRESVKYDYVNYADVYGNIFDRVATYANSNSTVWNKDTIPLTGTGASSTVTPRFVGDTYIKTDTSTVYISKGVTTSDWIAVN